ncbi:MAG: S9 family peptidase [Steroidobacteraceae bacterium]|jgi:dipeptidyl aminopeptidase/acylaminoacyl peptidase|nr:S9 family peptidase [Steroidobacteraceae bacterium]
MSRSIPLRSTLPVAATLCALATLFVGAPALAAAPAVAPAAAPAAPAVAPSPAAAASSAAAAVTRVERGSLILENVPEVPAVVKERLDAYLNARSAGLAGWTHDGRLLISTRFGDAAQIHVVDRAGGARRQLTFFREPVGSARPAPTAARGGFLFTKDTGGDENFQVWFQRYDAPGAVRLTSGRGQHGSVRWSNDGTRYAYSSTARDGRSYDLWVADPIARIAPRMVLDGQQRLWSVLDWAPDDSALLVINSVSVNEDHLYVLDLASGTRTPVDPPRRGERVAIGDARFAADGRGVWYSSDRDAEFQLLRYWDPATQRATVLTADVPWDVTSIEVAPNTGLVAFVTNENAASRLYLLDPTTRERRPAPALVPTMAPALISNLEFDPAGRRLAVAWSTARAPSDVHVLDLAAHAFEQWTFSEPGPVDTRRFQEAQLFTYPTFDRDGRKPRQISAFIVRPQGPGPHPVVIDIHGGPEAQARPGFDPLTQYLATELGYAVIEPNVRGSTGYGKTFVTLDNGFRREDAVKDIGALLDWIATQPDLDPKRVVVMGGSYGGYMTLATMTHYDARLLGGVSVVGISNFLTFLEATADYRRDLRRVEYGDERDPKMREFLQRISPLTNAGRITKPMLIGQGLNDPRVPARESEQIVAAIRANGGDAWYFAAKDEGHGFRKKPNRDAWLETLVTFLAQLKEST